jgi:hypothetical protein
MQNLCGDPGCGSCHCVAHNCKSVNVLGVKSSLKCAVPVLYNSNSQRRFWLLIFFFVGWDLAEWSLCVWLAKVATFLDSIPEPSGIVESEGRQMTQCWIQYIKEEKLNLNCQIRPNPEPWVIPVPYVTRVQIEVFTRNFFYQFCFGFRIRS